MAAQLLKLHWKSARWVLFPFTLATALLPVLTARLIISQTSTSYYYGGMALDISGGLGNFYPILAALTGALAAVTAWSWDHETGHVYALSLPISRARYAGLKFLTGLVLVALPALVLVGTALGSTVVLQQAGALEGVRAYPVALAAHYLAACLTTYGLFFALAAGRMRTAVVVLSVAVGLLVFGGPLTEFLVDAVPGLDPGPSRHLFAELLLGERSPLGVFGSSWMFIDV